MVNEVDKLNSALLSLGAVKLSFEKGFQWASGIQSPIYCDNRILISDVEARELISDMFLKLIRSKWGEPQMIAGTATAGIPHAAWLAQKMNLPMVYVRSKAKEHGTKSKVEGGSVQGKTLVLVEDLISTGGSSLQAAESLKEEGATLLGVVSIFSYQLQKAEAAFRRAQIAWDSLSDIERLSRMAYEKGKITSAEKQRLEAFFVELNKA